MTQNMTMKADEVDAELVERAARVFWEHEDEDQPYNYAIRHALAAVIPEVQRREREACAKSAERLVITHSRRDG